MSQHIGVSVFEPSEVDVHGIISCSLSKMWHLYSLQPRKGMMELVTNPKFVDQWDVYINLSSDSLPVYTPQVLSNLFQSRKGTNRSGRTDTLRGYNFVTSSSCITGLAPTNINMFPPMWHKRKHYEHLGDFNISFIDNYGEQTTEQLIIHFGSQWMILTPDFVRYLVTSLQDKDSLTSKFKAELIARRVLMSDETFIPTLIANHPSFRQTIPVVERDGALRIKSSEKLSFSINLFDMREWTKIYPTLLVVWYMIKGIKFQIMLFM
jgi:Core-2/I-Branching enzyme.